MSVCVYMSSMGLYMCTLLGGMADSWVGSGRVHDVPEQLVEEGRKFWKIVSKTTGARLKKFLIGQILENASLK